MVVVTPGAPVPPPHLDLKLALSPQGHQYYPAQDTLHKGRTASEPIVDPLALDGLLEGKLGNGLRARPPRPPRLVLPWRRKVTFSDGKHPEGTVLDPLKVSAVVFGRVVWTEREADYLLSQSVENWKKFLFLATNLPYVGLAFSALLLNRVEHRAWPAFMTSVCESSATYTVLATLVASSSFALHTSQCRVGHWCCSTARARTLHRRRVQDKIDLADCTCASLAVVGTIVCQGFEEVGPQMAFVVPIFFASIISKKLGYWNTYLVLHGIWHLCSAALLFHVFVPPHSPLRTWMI